MTDEVYACLRDAVTITKAYQIKTLASLRHQLRLYHYDIETINEALMVWANNIVSRE